MDITDTPQQIPQEIVELWEYCVCEASMEMSTTPSEGKSLRTPQKSESIMGVEEFQSLPYEL